MFKAKYPEIHSKKNIQRYDQNEISMDMFKEKYTEKIMLKAKYLKICSKRNIQRYVQSEIFRDNYVESGMFRSRFQREISIGN